MISNSDFNQKLIDLIDECMPAKSDQLDLLMNVTSLGREAAYRRLRGDVPFSFTEACMISQKIGRSLNEIVEADSKNNVTYYLATPEAESVDDYYYYYNRMIEEHEGFINQFSGMPNIKVISACNMVPHTKLFPFKYLSRFRAFQWKYQMEQGPIVGSLSDIVIPPHLVKRQLDLVGKIDYLSNTSLVFSRNTFVSLINQIDYFHTLNFISLEEIAVMKEELHQLVHDMETLTMNGKTNADEKVWVYLSNIDFESNYTYIQGEDFEFAYVDIFQLNSVITSDPIACKMQREWIESLRKYSTLISACGEKDRIAYFNKQHEHIEGL